MEALRAGCCAFLGRAAAEAVVVAALGAHAGLRPAHVTWAANGGKMRMESHEKAVHPEKCWNVDFHRKCWLNGTLVYYIYNYNYIIIYCIYIYI